ncbi:discoidin domain-containing protein [Nocardiopsis dassonvillei]|uniref:discoidin domain-containing protein n=1 Tax=Nocardiopsis dassonvillei TaxID=2014 RepID=UPI000B9D729B|nr:discoidin domain-containing protein [Nocardiopsis dassonvillei]ASU60605.1 cell wall assembly protein [Nocardiopsis dassonvillei]
MHEHPTVRVFRTERQRARTGEWLADHRLVVGFEPGGAVPLAQLGWRDLDGAEAVVGFEPGMTAFTGTRTTADGASHAWRGRLVEQLTDRPVHRFGVEGVDGEEELRLLIEDGGSPAARVTWADREGGGGAVALRTIALAEAGSGEEVTGGVREVRAGNEHTRAGEVAANLLDDTSSKWLSWRDADWLEFTMAEPVSVRHYVLVSANDFADRDPRNWALKGSADGRTWVTLDTRSDEFFPGRHHARDFHVTDPAADTPYRHLRLEITGNCGGSEIQLNRVRFFSEGRTYEAFDGHRYTAGGAPSPYGGIARDLLARVPATAEQWRAYLAGYSADMLRVLTEDELPGTTAEQRAASWLGCDGAPEERIAELEERLGRRLPPGYRAFLEASDGWGPASTFVYGLRSTAAVGWAADLEDECGVDESLATEEGGPVGPLLLVSAEGDAQDWVLDAGDVSPDGEWAAYTWSSWNPGPGERHRSFADLVAAERASFEELLGAEGRPVHPEGALELLARGRRAALEGRVEEALSALRRAKEKGSGAAAYLEVVLAAFLDMRGAHHRLRGLLHRPHVVAEVGTGRIEAEAVPLYLHSAGLDTPGGAAYADRALAAAVPGLDVPSGGTERREWLASRRLPESPAFERALDTARELAARGATDEAWAAIEGALPGWYPLEPNRIAPVVLLTDPALREVVTPARAREAVFTPRGLTSATGEAARRTQSADGPAASGGSGPAPARRDPR